jgi:uncharacterized membrane protein YdfJ with MMPL/SSD domain
VVMGLGNIALQTVDRGFRVPPVAVLGNWGMARYRSGEVSKGNDVVSLDLKM